MGKRFFVESWTISCSLEYFNVCACAAKESKDLAWIFKIILSQLNKYITITPDKPADVEPCLISPAILVNHCFFSTKLRLFLLFFLSLSFLFRLSFYYCLASPTINALPCAYLCPDINLLCQDNVLFLPSVPLFTWFSKVIRRILSINDPYKHHKVIKTN